MLRVKPTRPTDRPDPIDISRELDGQGEEDEWIDGWTDGLIERPNEGAAGRPTDRLRNLGNISG